MQPRVVVLLDSVRSTHLLLQRYMLDADLEVESARIDYDYCIRATALELLVLRDELHAALQVAGELVA